MAGRVVGSPVSSTAYRPGTSGYWTNPTTGGQTYLGADGKPTVAPPQIPYTTPENALGQTYLVDPASGSMSLGYTPRAIAEQQAITGTGPYGGGGGGGGGTGTRASAAPADNSAMLERMLSEIRSAPAPTRAPLSPYTSSATPGYDKASEDASYARAKDRTGLAMQAAMKGLKSAMGRRGIQGSGIEAEELERLHEAGLGALGDTDRQLAEQSAARSFTAGESRLGRDEAARQYDSSFGQSEEARMQQAQAQKLAQIMQAFSLAM